MSADRIVTEITRARERDPAAIPDQTLFLRLTLSGGSKTYGYLVRMNVGQGYIEIETDLSTNVFAVISHITAIEYEWRKKP